MALVYFVTLELLTLNRHLVKTNVKDFSELAKSFMLMFFFFQKAKSENTMIICRWQCNLSEKWSCKWCTAVCAKRNHDSEWHMVFWSFHLGKALFIIVPTCQSLASSVSCNVFVSALRHLCVWAHLCFQVSISESRRLLTRTLSNYSIYQACLL